MPSTRPHANQCNSFSIVIEFGRITGVEISLTANQITESQSNFLCPLRVELWELCLNPPYFPE